jgi:hypothetical protein
VYALRGFPEARPLFQVCAPDLEDDFPTPRDAVRGGGVLVSIWRREPAPAGEPEMAAAAPPVTVRTIDGRSTDDDVEVEFRRASNGPGGAFRLVVRCRGTVEEEYDGLTIGGATDAATIVNAHSTLIRIDS